MRACSNSYRIGRACLLVKGELPEYASEILAAFEFDKQLADPAGVAVGENCAMADLCLTKTERGMILRWYGSGSVLVPDAKRARKTSFRPLEYHLDFVPTVLRERSLPAPKQGAFNQALGKKTHSVIDATGGWGGDALLMSMQGYAVTVLERNPLMAVILHEAFSRLALSAELNDKPYVAPAVVYADSIAHLRQQEVLADCIYLDPMFPPKRKKSAAANKQMQLLQFLLGEDLDASELVAAAVESGVRRVAVKRPDFADSLFRQPDQQFCSKLVNYDVYLQ